MCAQALRGHARRWLVNEKGAITAAAPPPDAATALVQDTTDACQNRAGGAARDAPVQLVDYDPGWPQDFIEEAARVRAVLGDRALSVEHVGSTSVPAMPAKPIIDMLLVVADSTNEESYVPPLHAAGYVLRIREPDWHQHRLFKGPDRDLNLHVFSVGSPEIERLLRFRDQLRRNPGERHLYATTKRRLADRRWRDVQDYADAKSDVVETILAHAARRL
jgi:GrpB-like predicted nucleotidyltransferase (UPF0157 family)